MIAINKVVDDDGTILGFEIILETTDKNETIFIAKDQIGWPGIRCGTFPRKYDKQLFDCVPYEKHLIVKIATNKEKN